MGTYKEIARVCFNNAKESEELRKKVQEIFGDSGGMGLFDDVLLHCVRAIDVFTPEFIQECDAWWEDFWRTDDFEEFWNKWYETERRF